ncbi:hypothetical protein JCM3765_005365 [Sporobolomyces pararoseus]
MADSNPTLYASSFNESRSPPSTFHPISLRLSLHRALTQDLSAYFHERSNIEEQYVKSLQKLSSRFDHQHSSSSKDLIFSELDSFNLDPSTIDSQLGTSLNQVKKTLEQEVEQLIKSHSKWNKKLESTVEGPLRDSLTKRDWEKWGQEEKRFQGDIKEYESLVDKLSKAQTKSSKSSSKLLSTQSSLSTLGSSLTSSLPSFLNLSQSLEQSHVQLLKQSLTQYGTFSSDLGRDRMELGEKLVQQVLGIDESVEMTEWALREGMKASAGATGSSGLNEFGTQENQREREESNQTDNQSLANSSVAGGAGGAREDSNTLYANSTSNNQRERTSSRLSTAPPVAPLPLPTTAQDDSRSINSSTTTPSKSKSKKLGSKLSSFLGGGKKDKQEKEKEKRDRSSSIPNSSRYSSFNDSNAPPVPTAASGGGAGTLSPPPPMERSSSNRSNGSDGLMGGSAANEGNGSFQAPLQPTSPSDSNNKRNSLFPSLGGRTRSDSSGGGGGGLFRRGSRMNSIPDEYNETPTTNNNNSGYGSGAPFVAEPNSMNEGATGGGVDSEGFSVPPKGYDRAIGEGVSNRNLMDDDDDDDYEAEQNQRSVPKLNILGVSTSSNNSNSIPSLPASPVLPQESEEERLAALSAIKNSLGAPPSGSSSVAGGLNRRATARGRRSEAGSVPAPNRPHSMLPSAAGLSAAAGAAAIGGGVVGVGALERRETDDDVPLATIQQEHQQQQQAATQRRKAPPPPSAPSAASPTSPTFPATGATPIASSINNPSRAMSILSTNSSITPSVLGGGGALVRKDPFEGVTESGVRISIVEQINVLMKAGEVQKVLVTGEIGLSYRPTTDGQDEEPLVLKLTNHEQMEKTAPNSTYLTPTSSTSNEFTLSKSSLLSKNGQTVPILKYQLRPTGSKELVPLIVKPTWRCEPNLTRIIVVYSQNPSFSTFSSSSSPFGDDETSSTMVDYSDLKLEVPFNQGQITSFQSKPPSIGTLSPTNGSLVFSLPPPKSSSAAEEKLLVSAQTEGTEAARVGNMSLKWRVEGKTLGRLGVELIGGEGVKEVRRELESGKYIIA